jgi:hypothetical protein
MRRVHTVCFLVLILFPFLWACQTKPDEAALRVVQAFLSEAREGQWDQAMARVDLHAKCLDMFGDIYSRGDVSDQQVTQAVLGGRLQRSTEVTLDRHFRHGDGTLTALVVSEGHVEVTQGVKGYKAVYDLHRGEGGWRIVDRTHEEGGQRPNRKMLNDALLRAIRSQVGHDPDLKEVNGYLEDTLGKLRQRTYRVQ